MVSARKQIIVNDWGWIERTLIQSLRERLFEHVTIETGIQILKRQPSRELQAKERESTKAFKWE